MKHTFIYPRDKSMLERALGLIDKPHRIELKPYRHSRSLEQNALMWVWFRELSQSYQDAYGEWKSDQTWHDIFVDEFLTVEVTEVKGKVYKLHTTTSELNVEEFSDFLTQIDQFCAEELGILLTHPAEYHRAMGGE